MATTQLRGSNQVIDGTITRAKLVNDFVDGATWVLSSTNTAILQGIDTPVGANDAVNKSYVDGLVDSSMKSPDGYATNAAGDYPTDYKGTGAVAEGDMFYITDITAGSVVGTATVNVGDALVALQDVPGNVDANWVIMESNRDQATETVKGVLELATQAETDAGLVDTDAVTPLKLATYIANLNINKVAGAGLTETAGTFDVVATDASILVNADDLGVQVGSTNGASLEVTATGVELLSSIAGDRTFTGNTFTVNAPTSATIGAPVNGALLTSQPDGTVPLAISTTKYVDDQMTAGTITASNGLTKTGNDIALGGNLTGATTVDGAGNNLSLLSNDTGDFKIGSGVGTDFANIGIHAATSINIGTSGNTVIDASGNISLEPLGNLNLGHYVSTVTITAGASDDALLSAQPTGTVDLAIATTKYVNDALAATTKVYNELPAVTNGNANVTLLNSPTAGTERIYLNGVRQAPGAANDYTISGTTVTFGAALVTGDLVLVDYEY